MNWSGYVERWPGMDTSNVDVHGGITYRGHAWIGWDCAHASRGDCMPGFFEGAEMFPTLSRLLTGRIYRDFDFAVNETTALARQLKDSIRHG